MNDSESVPVFGERLADQRYVLRPSAYALMQNDRDEFAIVETPVGVFLPGGGIEGNETPAQAIVREVLEECGLVARPGPEVARALQLAYSVTEGVYFEKPSVFLRATVHGPGIVASEADHTLIWLPAEAAAERMAHESHAWILRSLAPGSSAGAR
jgi:8-oxo-dGTP diphosphatase